MVVRCRARCCHTSAIFSLFTHFFLLSVHFPSSSPHTHTLERRAPFTNWFVRIPSFRSSFWWYFSSYWSGMPNSNKFITLYILYTRSSDRSLFIHIFMLLVYSIFIFDGQFKQGATQDFRKKKKEEKWVDLSIPLNKLEMTLFSIVVLFFSLFRKKKTHTLIMNVYHFYLVGINFSCTEIISTLPGIKPAETMFKRNKNFPIAIRSAFAYWFLNHNAIEKPIHNCITKP